MACTVNLFCFFSVHFYFFFFFFFFFFLCLVVDELQLLNQPSPLLPWNSSFRNPNYIFTRTKKRQKKKDKFQMNILEIFFQVFLGEFASFSLCTVEEKKTKQWILCLILILLNFSKGLNFLFRVGEVLKNNDLNVYFCQSLDDRRKQTGPHDARKYYFLVFVLIRVEKPDVHGLSHRCWFNSVSFNYSCWDSHSQKTIETPEDLTKLKKVRKYSRSRRFFTGSPVEVNRFCSGPRPILHPSLVEICPGVFV